MTRHVHKWMFVGPVVTTIGDAALWGGKPKKSYNCICECGKTIWGHCLHGVRP